MDGYMEPDDLVESGEELDGYIGIASRSPSRSPPHGSCCSSRTEPVARHTGKSKAIDHRRVQRSLRLSSSDEDAMGERVEDDDAVRDEVAEGVVLKRAFVERENGYQAPGTDSDYGGVSPAERRAMKNYIVTTPSNSIPDLARRHRPTNITSHHRNNHKNVNHNDDGDDNDHHRARPGPSRGRENLSNSTNYSAFENNYTGAYPLQSSPVPVQQGQADGTSTSGKKLLGTFADDSEGESSSASGDSSSGSDCGGREFLRRGIKRDSLTHHAISSPGSGPSSAKGPSFSSSSSSFSTNPFKRVPDDPSSPANLETLLTPPCWGPACPASYLTPDLHSPASSPSLSNPTIHLEHNDEDDEYNEPGILN